MKREFIKNLIQDISKEALDAIMDENGRDIESAKKPFADYDTTTKNPFAEPFWDGALVANEMPVMQSELQAYVDRKVGRQ